MSATRPVSSQSGGASPPSSGIPNPVLRATIDVGRRLLNPLILALAGRRHVQFFGVIHHRGRRSGRAYATPVAARPTPTGFVIALTFGESADWFQNLRAAGGGVIRWNGVDYPVVDPVVVDWATACPAFRPAERALVPLIGIPRFVQLRHAAAGGNDPTGNVSTSPRAWVTGQEASPLSNPLSQLRHVDPLSVDDHQS